MTESPKAAIIEKIRKVSHGVRITVSILPEPLFLPSNIVEQDNLKEGMELHPNYLRQLQTNSEFNECDAKAAGILSRRDYSVGEFKRKLRLQNFNEDTVKEIASKYKSKGLLDDRKYALKIVEKILNEKPSGKPYLIATLRRKLIHRELAYETVNSILENQDDAALAVSALRKRWRRFGQFDVEEARRKAYNYLSRRGFSYSAAKDAFAKLWQEDAVGSKEEEDY